ncbi:MAG: hypothetical protein GY830_00855 [Bacteroidetes bacterium]|nr:hypothetical protein [Bacteroidota bacterium]
MIINGCQNGNLNQNSKENLNKDNQDLEQQSLTISQSTNSNTSSKISQSRKLSNNEIKNDQKQKLEEIQLPNNQNSKTKTIVKKNNKNISNFPKFEGMSQINDLKICNLNYISFNVHNDGAYTGTDVTNTSAILMLNYVRENYQNTENIIANIESVINEGIKYFYDDLISFYEKLLKYDLETFTKKIKQDQNKYVVYLFELIELINNLIPNKSITLEEDYRNSKDIFGNLKDINIYEKLKQKIEDSKDRIYKNLEDSKKIILNYKTQLKQNKNNHEFSKQDLVILGKLIRHATALYSA